MEQPTDPLQSCPKKVKPESPKKGSMKERVKNLNYVYLWDKRQSEELLDGIVVAGLERKYEEEEAVLLKKNPYIQDILCAELKVHDKMFCGTCVTEFTERENQVDHFKSDWHRFNLKRKLKGEDYVTEDSFEEITKTGDLSSISGSDSSTDDESSKSQPIDDENDDEFHHVEGIGRRHPRVFLRNRSGELISVFRTVVHGKINRADTPEELLSMVTDIPCQMTWAIFMLAGGHFAGAVFQGDTVIEHKTFHRYVIRAKRGTVQSSRDNKGNAPKSGGATLRRYNEAALAQEIQDLISSWAPHLKLCHRIFIRAPTYNKSVFYGGKNPVLGKTDVRIRMVPFQTRRPTFKELKRVHQVLATVELHGSESKIEDHVIISLKKINTAQQSTKQITHQPAQQPKTDLTTTVTDWIQTKVDEEDSDKDDEITVEIMTESLTIATSELNPFDVSKKSRKKKKTQKPKKEVDEKMDPVDLFVDLEVKALRNNLYTACKLKNVEQLNTLLMDLREKFGSDESTMKIDDLELKSDESTMKDDDVTNTESSIQVELSTSSLLNSPFGDHGQTLLHVAAIEGCKPAVVALMEHGADPTIKDGQGRLPYIVTSSKDTRNEFRRFMAKYPDKYDYGKAQIPGPLSEDQEKEKKERESERKKMLKKVKKERQKDQKEIEAKERSEQEEKDRFIALTDREKRALAADRRLMSQASSTGLSLPTLSRCYQCASDISGKVPFEYAEFKFCSPKCLKAHRLVKSGKKS